MVATDTIVGIVGAVVLVGVMAGVFIYEYNQPDDPTPIDEGPDEPTGFAADYPTLAAAEDMDGDGVPNEEDPDMDGDGDNEVVGADCSGGAIEGTDCDGIVVEVYNTEVTLGAHVPEAAPADPVELQQFLGTGVQQVHVQASYSPTVPDRNTVAMTLLGPDGAVVVEGETYQPPSDRAVNPMNLVIDLEAGIDPGNYTLRLAQVDASGEVNFINVWFIITYIPAEEPQMGGDGGGMDVFQARTFRPGLPLLTG